VRTANAVTLVCSLVVGAACADAPTAPDQDPGPLFSSNAPLSSVTGGGRVVYDPGAIPGYPDYAETYGISARARPDGSVEGMIESHWPAPYDVEFHGAVGCLKVVGNIAVIGYEVTRTDNDAGYPVGSRWVFRVRDDGTGPDTDAISYFYPVGNVGACQTLNLTNTPWFTWTDGNITIR
jgi:hypothetical protein